MLSDEQAALLIKYFQTIHLTGEQKDRLIATYWEANHEERKEIARAYAHIFATDAEFVQRLLAYHDQRLAVASPTAATTAPGSSFSSSPSAPHGDTAGAGHKAGGVASAHHTTHNGAGSSSDGSSPTSSGNGGGGGGGYGSPASPSGGGGGGGATVRSPLQLNPRLTHSQMLLRTAIQDQFPKLTGPGPFPISFGLVETESERKEAVDLYASQFERPEPPELQRLVTLPEVTSTRTRRRIRGSYTWFLRSHTTGEMVCAVTVTAHHHQTHHFVEMPLFATAAGYKKNGLGRLLNAALAAWCVNADFEFTMVSADVQAIPFWKRLGYVMMSRSEKNGIAFFYEHECYKFEGAEPMIGYCFRRSASIAPLSDQRVEDVLKAMPKFVMTGPLQLPGP